MAGGNGAAGDRRVCLGVIAAARGLKGEVRIRSYTADPRDIAAYGPLQDESGTRRMTLSVVRVAKSEVVARIAGVEDRGAAEALKGMRLYVPRARLPATGGDEFYHADLIGLAVELVGGEALGEVVAVQDFGAGDMIEVRRTGGGTVLVPFTRTIVPVVDLAAGRVVVDPPPGLLAPVPGGEDDGEDER